MDVTEYRRILLDGAVVEVTRDGDELYAPDGRSVKLDGAVHLPPCEPSKIIAVHLNHRSRVEEFQARLPAAPTYFHKPTSALNAHGGAVVRPEGCRWLNYEGEVAIVIGRTCRNIAPDEAGDHIRGYTIANDYGLHDFRDTDAGSMLRVKGSDTLCPLGPGLVTDWDFRGRTLTTRVNGEVKQRGSTDEMEWDMHYLVADIARTITLHPATSCCPGRRPIPAPCSRGTSSRSRWTGSACCATTSSAARKASAATWEHSPRSRRRSAPRLSAATGSSAASARLAADAP
ncbi:hypothetical protein GCM10018954_070490 [Kutzneria kofuensis]